MTIDAIIKNGYTWNEWTGTKPSSTKSYSFTMPAGNIENVANTTMDTYTITYSLDDGTLEISNPTSYTVETPTFVLNNPKKTGYTFLGWTGSNGTTPELSVSIATGSTGNKSYTANWRQNKVVVNIQRNEVEWSNSGIKVALYQNGVEKYSTIVISGTKAEFEFVEPGVYDIYAGKNSNEKVTLVDTGKDITVGDTNTSS